ncbi:MAG: M43 family zinc metalloprotease [Ekhidna sp.]
MTKNILRYVLALILFSKCGSDNDVIPIDKEPDLENPSNGVYSIPIVVHILHNDEPLGEGGNLSEARILKQIESLNNDYRKRQGTNGFNDHPDGTDAKVEFVLASQTPEGKQSNGIVRINMLDVDNPMESNSTFDYCAYYSYWNPEEYLNIWTVPYLELTDVFLGLGTGPETDLPGKDALAKGEPFQAEGVIINAGHFGESSLSTTYNLGRTLTHEVGHYLGLLHPWGLGDCDFNDYCADTPKVNVPVTSCTPAIGCDGEEIQVQNYMNWSPDDCMNMFTNDQAFRMHYVLENSPRRKTLLSSKGLQEPL